MVFLSWLIKAHDKYVVSVWKGSVLNKWPVLATVHTHVIRKVFIDLWDRRDGDGNKWSDRHVVGQIMATLIEQTNINQMPMLAHSRAI